MAKKKSEHVRLGQWMATAICGNDILSSCLYVSGIAVAFSGIYAPLVLLVIAGVLLIYKFVYTEVVEALPVNGGAYNCLLNGTSKTTAAIAGIITVLSYMATAVLSATISIQYLHSILSIPVIFSTIALLFVFAVLVIMGIRDSAKVAFAIFVFHIISLCAFLIFGIMALGHANYFLENLKHSQGLLVADGGFIKVLFLGFSASLLGVSGFESSANFVEEQQKGVFRKTLRNMLLGVAFFNPIIALIVLGVSPIEVIVNSKEFLLSNEALIIGGKYFQYLIVVDAFFVLAGAVLTSFIGVSGLVYRMAADGCLPEFLTKQNRSGSHPFIVIIFFILCSSILVITKGNLLSLAGVYTIAFLSVMSLFALGNLILRQTRTELKRTYYAPIILVMIAFIATILGIIGNVQIDRQNFTYFSMYFAPALVLVFSMVFKDQLLTMLLHLTRKVPLVHRFISVNFHDITSGTVVAFINHVDRIHNILSYINHNETAKNVYLVHCRNWDFKTDRDRYNEIKEVMPHIRKAGVFPHLRIKLLYENEPFGPEAIVNVSKKLKVRKNRIMIGSIHHFHKFDYSDFGGVRIIF
jgi:amino acid transporter